MDGGNTGSSFRNQYVDQLPGLTQGQAQEGMHAAEKGVVAGALCQAVQVLQQKNLFMQVSAQVAEPLGIWGMPAHVYVSKKATTQRM